MPEPAVLISVIASCENRGSHPSKTSTSDLLPGLPGLSAEGQVWLPIHVKGEFRALHYS